MAFVTGRDANKKGQDQNDLAREPVAWLLGQPFLDKRKYIGWGLVFQEKVWFWGCLDSPPKPLAPLAGFEPATLS
jgi:hypothetical protein